jgi:glycine/D-amino acid oxidase-like deaminating enzyme
MSGPTPNGPTPSGAAAARLDPDPYWWEAAPRPRLDEIALPAEVDVAIVGSGITGLNAARVLARAGRRVLVLEAREPGWGASSRNAGYCGRTLKHSFLGLMEKRGLAAALAIYREMRQAYDAVAEVVRGEQIDCAYRVCGRFIAANSPRHYDEMARELAARREHLGDEFEMVPRAAQHREIGSDLYHGGALIPEMAALHPGRYHLGLLEAARRNGVEIAVNTAVGRVTGGEGRFDEPRQPARA